MLRVLHHVGIEVDARATSSARSSFWELLGFERVEPPADARASSPGSNARGPRST